MAKLPPTAVTAPNQRTVCIEAWCIEDSCVVLAFLVLYLCSWEVRTITSNIFEEARQQLPFIGPTYCAYLSILSLASHKRLEVLCLYMVLFYYYYYFLVQVIIEI